MTKEKTSETVPPVGVKTSYLRDLDNPDRVLTVVRVFDPATKSVKFGWSINCPTEWKRTDGVKLVKDEATGTEKRVGVVIRTEKKGDQFCRKTGRTLAIAKMESDTHVAYLANEKETPLKAVLKYIVAEGNRIELPFHVVAVAEQHIPLVRDYVPFKEIVVVPKRGLLDDFMSWLRGV